MSNTMKCNQAREYLLDLAEGQAPAEVRSHLAGCSACATEFESLKATMNLLDEWKAPEPSPYFDQKLAARLREERAAAAQPRGVLAWLSLRWQQTAAVAAVAAVAFAIGLTQLGPNDNPPPVKSAAVADLQQLDQNSDLYANFDLLDELADENY
jgi:anti-sigma factor RsiW